MRKKETICRLQLRQLETQTRTETKVSIFSFLASGIAQTMEKDKFLRSVVIKEAKMYLIENDKNKEQ